MPRDLLAELNDNGNPFGKTPAKTGNPFGDNTGNPFGAGPSSSTGNPFGGPKTSTAATGNPFGTSSQPTGNPFGSNDVENPPPQEDPDAAYLASLKQKLWESSSEEEEEPLDFADVSKRFGELNDQIDQIQELTSRIKKKVREYEEMTNSKEMSDMHRRITNDFTSGRDVSSRVAIQLKDLRTDIFDSVKTGKAADAAKIQFQRNQFQQCKGRYQSALQDYMEADEMFRSVKENRTRRLAKTMDVELTQQQVEDFVQDPAQAQKMLEQQLASDALLENLAHLEETRDAMRSIEQGVKDILEMWKDFNAILEVQQEQIDSIEANIVKAHVKVKKGVEYLEKAESHQQCARKNQCILICCCGIALLALSSGLGIGLT